MAVLREVPTCSFCGEVIAEGIYIDQKDIPQMQRLIGDTFLRWKYKNHSCKGSRKAAKELKSRLKTLDKVDWQSILLKMEQKK